MTHTLVIADRLHHATARRKDRFKNRQVFIVSRILREIGERFTLCTNDAARIRGFETGDDTKKRRFAGAVGTDNSDLVTVLEAERDVLKKRLKAIIF